MVMPVKWNFNLFVDGSQSLNLVDKFESSAYDKISFSIPDGTTDLLVNVQPGDIKDITFFCVKSDKYTTDLAKQLCYKVADSTTAINLDQAHVLIGNSIVSLLDKAPTTLKFSNATGSPANVVIIVGRKATAQED
jgi:hypothetical protein